MRILFFILLFAVTAIHGQDFTIGTVPDIQNLVASNSPNLAKGMQFYVDQKDTLNIKFVAFLGDYTAHGYDGFQSSHTDWQRSKDASFMLRDANIPYSVCIGNHDMDYVPCMDKPELALTRFMEYYPVSDYEDVPEFGGYFRNMSNNYFLFSASGMDFIIVTLQTHDNNAYYDTTSINWANKIIQEYSDRRAIFVSHDFYESRRLIKDVITKHDNLFLAICGHSCSREAFWTEKSPSGNTVNCMMADYQCDSDKGATLRYLTFKPDQNQIYAYTWNAVKNSYETDANSQFTFDYFMRSPEKPVIFNIKNDPIYPMSTDTTNISARIIDDFGIIKSTLNWGVTSGDLTNSVDMVADGEYFNATIPAYDDQQKIYYTISASDGDGNESASTEKYYIVDDDRTTLPCPYNPSQTSYKNEVPEIPGIIEAENYNKGCVNAAYYDTGDNNFGGAYRTNTGVDIAVCTEGGYNVGWFVTGEWLNYEVDVQESTEYSFDFRNASNMNGSEIHLELDGTDISGPIYLPSTGGAQTWQTSTIHNINLSEGIQTLKIVVDNGNFNLNYFQGIKSSEWVGLQNSFNNSNTFQVYPNRVKSHAYVVGITKKDSVLELYGVTGEKVKEWSFTKTDNMIEINLSNIPSGCYYLIEKETKLRSQLIIL